MTLEWIRFWITAALLVLGLIAFACAVLGVWRFGYMLNRIHAAGIGDTLGILCIIAGLVISSDSLFDALKLVLLIFFLWFTSPVSTHFLAQAEYYTNEKVTRHVRKGQMKQMGQPEQMDRPEDDTGLQNHQTQMKEGGESHGSR